MPQTPPNPAWLIQFLTSLGVGHKPDLSLGPLPPLPPNPNQPIKDNVSVSRRVPGGTDGMTYADLSTMAGESGGMMSPNINDINFGSDQFAGEHNYHFPSWKGVDIAPGAALRALARHLALNPNAERDVDASLKYLGKSRADLPLNPSVKR